jgi:photosystem II stability/assembly factor-like uncharacterized protein
LGILQTRDSGVNFGAVNSGFAQRQISDLIADPNDQRRFFAGIMGDGETGGVLVTDNNGEAWKSLGPGLGGRDVLSLLYTSEPEPKLLAGTSDGIFEFVFQEGKWTNNSEMTLRPNAARVPARRFVAWELYRRDDRQPIYAATSTGLLMSNDGRIWERLPLELNRGTVSSVTVLGSEGKTLLAGTSTGVKVSRDTGRTWSDVSLVADDNLRIESIASHPKSPNVVFVGTTAGLFRSTDAGVSWERFGHGIPYSAIRKVLVAPHDPRYILVASASGIFESSDGGSYYERLDESTIHGLTIHSLALSSSDNPSIFAASAHNGIFRFGGRTQIAPSTAQATNPAAQF